VAGLAVLCAVHGVCRFRVVSSNHP
jgi:hypothetical protein